MQFNVEQFLDRFNVGIRAFRESERISKEFLSWASRDLLCQLHITEGNAKAGDISFVNETLKACTPMNRKVFIMFMQEFAGFIYVEKDEQFTKKDKGSYNDKLAKAMEALEDPHFNIWTWADRNVKMEKKAFKLETLTKDVKKALAAKDDDGASLYNQADVVRALFEGGLTVEALRAALEGMIDVQ